MRLSMFHAKGGVGKTSAVKELSAPLADAGLRVLLVDLDPQASLSALAGVDGGLHGGATVARLLLPEAFPAAPLRDLLVTAPWSPDVQVIPSALSLENATLPLSNTNTPGAIERLKRGLDLLAAELAEAGDRPYDIVLIDSPPASNSLSINALTASTHILVPCLMHNKDIVKLPATFSTIQQLNSVGGLSLNLLGVLPQAVDRRVNHDVDNLHALEKRFGSKDLSDPNSPGLILPDVPVATAINQGDEQHSTLQAVKPNGKAAKRYRKIAAWIALVAASEVDGDNAPADSTTTAIPTAA